MSWSYHCFFQYLLDFSQSHDIFKCYIEVFNNSLGSYWVIAGLCLNMLLEQWFLSLWLNRTNIDILRFIWFNLFWYFSNLTQPIKWKPEPYFLLWFLFLFLFLFLGKSFHGHIFLCFGFELLCYFWRGSFLKEFLQNDNDFIVASYSVDLITLIHEILCFFC